MKQAVRRGLWWGGLLSLAVAVAWAQTTRPPAAAKHKLERLKIAVAPLGWDTNFTWLQTRSHKFNEFAEIPMFWLFAEAAVNPKYIAEYVFPGVITGSFTHLEYVKVAQ